MAWKVTALPGQDLEVEPCMVEEVELQVVGGQSEVVGGRHSWTLGRQSRCCREGTQMLQEEVAHPGSTWPRCLVTLCKVECKIFTLRWKKTGRRELKRRERQCSAFDRVSLGPL